MLSSSSLLVRRPASLVQGRGASLAALPRCPVSTRALQRRQVSQLKRRKEREVLLPLLSIPRIRARRRGPTRASSAPQDPPMCKLAASSR
jgi:hypothetical protein